MERTRRVVEEQEEDLAPSGPWVAAIRLPSSEGPWAEAPYADLPLVVRTDLEDAEVSPVLARVYAEWLAQAPRLTEPLPRETLAHPDVALPEVAWVTPRARPTVLQVTPTGGVLWSVPREDLAKALYRELAPLAPGASPLTKTPDGTLRFTATRVPPDQLGALLAASVRQASKRGGGPCYAGTACVFRCGKCFGRVPVYATVCLHCASEGTPGLLFRWDPEFPRLPLIVRSTPYDLPDVLLGFYGARGRR